MRRSLPARRRGPSLGWAVVLCASALIASGCIGATDRSDFDAEVRARGGGITAEWVGASIDLVAAEVGVTDSDDLEFLNLTINPTSRLVTATARRADRPDFLDTVVVKEGDVVGVTPIQDADRLPLDDLVIAVGELPFDDLERLSEIAIDEFGEADGSVRSIAARRDAGEPILEFAMESARRTGTVSFNANGSLVGQPR